MERSAGRFEQHPDHHSACSCSNNWRSRLGFHGFIASLPWPVASLSGGLRFGGQRARSPKTQSAHQYPSGKGEEIEVDDHSRLQEHDDQYLPVLTLSAETHRNSPATARLAGQPRLVSPSDQRRRLGPCRDWRQACPEAFDELSTVAIPISRTTTRSPFKQYSKPHCGIIAEMQSPAPWRCRTASSFR